MFVWVKNYSLSFCSRRGRQRLQHLIMAMTMVTVMVMVMVMAMVMVMVIMVIIKRPLTISASANIINTLINYDYEDLPNQYKTMVIQMMNTCISQEAEMMWRFKVSITMCILKRRKGWIFFHGQKRVNKMFRSLNSTMSLFTILNWQTRASQKNG